MFGSGACTSKRMFLSWKGFTNETEECFDIWKNMPFNEKIKKLNHLIYARDG